MEQPAWNGPRGAPTYLENPFDRAPHAHPSVRHLSDRVVDAVDARVAQFGQEGRLCLLAVREQRPIWMQIKPINIDAYVNFGRTKGAMLTAPRVHWCNHGGKMHQCWVAPVAKTNSKPISNAPLLHTGSSTRGYNKSQVRLCNKCVLRCS